MDNKKILTWGLGAFIVITVIGLLGGGASDKEENSVKAPESSKVKSSSVSSDKKLSVEGKVLITDVDDKGKKDLLVQDKAGKLFYITYGNEEAYNFDDDVTVKGTQTGTHELTFEDDKMSVPAIKSSDIIAK